MAGKPRAATILEVSEVASINLREELGGSDALPVRSFNLDLGGGRRGFVFTMSEATRRELTTEKVRQIAQVLGGLVHPHSGTLVVLPGDADLRVWEVTSK